MTRLESANVPNLRTSSGELKHRSTLWLIWPLVLILFLASTNAGSQSTPAGESMPPWTVLALKLVSTTHVQPTTGIVIAAPNLVLVGVDFAREGDEIMVLDGGTDIVRHGRPATIVHTLPADKLAILKVQGLNRPAASLSALSEAELKSLNLVAFPPAEMIAKGSAPVRSAVKALPAITTSHPTLDPFPNVSGALTDDCGNLIAFNLAVGVQSMQATSSPRVAWPDALRRAAALAGKPLQAAECSSATAQATDQPATEVPPVGTQEKETKAQPALQDEPGAEPEAEPGAEPQEETPAAADPEPLPAAESVDEAEAVEESPVEPAAEREAEAATDESPEEAADGTLELDTSTLDSAANAGSIKEHAGPWSKAGPLIAGLVLILALIGWLLRRRTKAARSTSSQAEATGDKQPFDEPGTVRFATTNTGSAPLLLRLSGVLPGDTTGNRPFTLQVPISGPNWKVELGRELTDLVLASPSVSRRHAGLQLLDGRMTITDFDSTNGTRVNGVSCLAGEVFFVSSGDQLQFGEVLCTLLLSATDNAGDNSGVSEPAKPTPEPGSRPPA